MKKILVLFFVFYTSFCIAQEAQDAATLHATAKSFMQQGDYENAVLVLTKALQMEPNDLQISKDLLFTYYLKRDFAKALETGKQLVQREDADVQSFQMLGLAYRAIAQDDEAEKLYKTAMKKFPGEGVLYSEYGELVSPGKIDNAVKLWQKGVDVDPNYSGNYYFLAKQYALNGDILWSILYAEMFLNMESFTARSTEMKNLLLEQYKKYFATGYTTPKPVNKKGVDKKADKKFVAFTSAVAETLNKQQAQITLGITPESLTVIRTRFILDWYNTYGNSFPFRLFDHQRQLLQEGMFQAYNYWLFGPAANIKTYQTWQQYHQEELNTFLTFIRSKVFKVPEGQQYYLVTK